MRGRYRSSAWTCLLAVAVAAACTTEAQTDGVDGGASGDSASGSESGGAEDGDAGTSSAEGTDVDTSDVSSESGSTTTGDGDGDGDPMCVESADCAAAQAVLDDLVEGLDGGAALAVRYGTLTCCVASGHRDVSTNQPVEIHTPFKIGSVTKTFTAAAILALLESGGDFELGTPVSNWNTQLASADSITVQHLLSMASGVPDYIQFVPEGVEVTPEELIESVGDTLLFPPGSTFHYSNTNFALLGIIVREVSGGPVSSYFHERLTDPLGLANTYLDGEEEVPDDMAHGYAEGVDVTYDVHPSKPWTAGAMVAGAPDIRVWADALYGAAVLSSTTTADMMIPKVGPYGYGGMPMDDGGWGHNGVIPGYSSLVVHYPSQDITFALLVANDAMDLSTVAPDILAAAP